MGPLSSILRGGGDTVSWWCPGCEDAHAVKISGPGSWGYNGNADRPTFTPSVLVRTGHYIPERQEGPCWCTWAKEHPEEDDGFKCAICHSFVIDGQMQFLGDCTHALAGKTVPIPPLPDHMKDEA